MELLLREVFNNIVTFVLKGHFTNFTHAGKLNSHGKDYSACQKKCNVLHDDVLKVVLS